MTNNVVILSGGDWQGIYVNGDLFRESRNLLRPSDFANLINKHRNFYSATTRSLNEDGLVWLENNGGLPEKLWNLPDGLYKPWN